MIMTMEEYAAQLREAINDSVDDALARLQSQSESEKGSINNLVLKKNGALRNSMETYDDGDTISVDWMVDYAGEAYYHYAAKKTTEGTYDHWLDPAVNPEINARIATFQDNILNGIIESMR